MVIIGGVAGGATAAARIRRLDEQAEIVVLERSGFISYANCGLPYYIGGVIQDQEELTLQTPQGFWDRFRIDVRVRHEATAIHREEKTVTVKNLETGEVTTESYDKLILAPGARPTRPPIPGLDSDRLFSLRTVEDTLAIRAFVEREKPRTRRAGRGRLHQPGAGGKPGRDGVQVTIVQRIPQVMHNLDYDMATFLHAHLRQKGMTLRLGASVAGFRQEGKTITTLVEGGADIPADLAILAVGVTPESTLAQEAGPGLGRPGEHRRQRLDADLRPRYLRRGGRCGDPSPGHRSEDPHLPGRAGQQAGPGGRRPPLRPGQPLPRGPGVLGDQGVRPHRGLHRPQREERPGGGPGV